jgi:23S rRNA pseudouridine2605 synthase
MKKENAPSATSERIAKRIAHSGLCSRRDAERLIEDGVVKINGKVCIEPGTKVTADDQIMVSGKMLPKQTSLNLFIFNKPTGFLVTKKDQSKRPTIYDLLPRKLHSFHPVGRLDMMTEGLLLLTNDGEFKRYLEHPQSKITRRYHVRVYGCIDQERLTRLEKGVRIDGVRYKPQKIKPLKPLLDKPSNFWLEIDLAEGKNREIRVLMEHINLKVSRLTRTAFGPFKLHKLEKGGIEHISDKKIQDCFKDYFRK